MIRRTTLLSASSSPIVDLQSDRGEDAVAVLADRPGGLEKRCQARAGGPKSRAAHGLRVSR
jgi:hypothetical protein